MFSLERILAWDQQIFERLNHGPMPTSLNLLFVTITELHKQPWFLFGVLPALLVLWFYKDR